MTDYLEQGATVISCRHTETLKYLYYQVFHVKHSLEPILLQYAMLVHTAQEAIRNQKFEPISHPLILRIAIFVFFLFYCSILDRPQVSSLHLG